MSDFVEKIKSDIELGTPGEWVCHFGSDEVCQCRSVLGAHGGMGALAHITVDNGLHISEGGNDAPDEVQSKANARRIVRVPELEQIAIECFNTMIYEYSDIRYIIAKEKLLELYRMNRNFSSSNPS